MVALCRLKGMTAQEAFDQVGSLLQDRYQRWDVLETYIPSWGEVVDPEVEKYISGIKTVVRANLHWRSVNTDEKTYIYMLIIVLSILTHRIVSSRKDILVPYPKRFGGPGAWKSWLSHHIINGPFLSSPIFFFPWLGGSQTYSLSCSTVKPSSTSSVLMFEAALGQCCSFLSLSSIPSHVNFSSI